MTLLALGMSLMAWASAFAGIRAALQAYKPGHLILLRFLVASCLLAGYAAVRKMRIPAAKDMPAMLLLGLAGFTVYQVGLAFGEVTVSAGVASLLSASAPIFTALIATVFLRERLTSLAWLGIGVSFVGIALIVWGEGTGVRLDVGAWLILFAAFSESVYFVFQKPYFQKYSPVELTAYTVWSGTLFMLIFAPGLGTAIQRAPLAATISIIYLGMVPTMLAFLAWNFALARMPASVATTFLFFLPVLAVIIAWLWLGEIPTLLSIFGGILTLLGVVAVNWKGYSRFGRSTDDRSHPERMRTMHTAPKKPKPSPFPTNLPAPVDDRAAAHLRGVTIPELRLLATSSHEVNLADLAAGALVLYVFPNMGSPDIPDPAGWLETPGAYGCTQQSCAFRDRYPEFSALGYAVAGLSAQSAEEQKEAAERLRLAFPLLADPDRRLGAALRLPTFEIAGVTLYKRLTLVARNRRIMKVFYPVFPPHENPEEVLAWIQAERATG